MTAARDALLAVAALVAPDVPEAGARAVAAHDDPVRYVEEHADRLDRRGISAPMRGLAWIALVDALTDHGLLAEVDWKEAPDEITAQLRDLRSAPPGDEVWAGLADDDRPTYDFLTEAGTRLATHGTALAVLDIESDCYPLVLLPALRAPSLPDLASAAEFTALVFGT